MSENDGLSTNSRRDIWRHLERIGRDLAQLRRELEFGRDRDEDGDLDGLVAEVRRLRQFLEGQRRREEAVDRALSSLAEAVLRLTHSRRDGCCHSCCEPAYPPYPPFPPFPPYPPYPANCCSPPCPQPCAPAPPAPQPAPPATGSSSSSSTSSSGYVYRPPA